MTALTADINVLGKEGLALLRTWLVGTRRRS